MAGNIRASYPSIPGAFRRMPTTLNSYQSGGRPQHPLEQRMGLDPGSTNPGDWAANRVGAMPMSQQVNGLGAIGRLFAGQATFGQQQPAGPSRMDFGSGQQALGYQVPITGAGRGVPQRPPAGVIDGPSGQAWSSQNGPATRAQALAADQRGAQGGASGWSSWNQASYATQPVQPGGTPFLTLQTQSQTSAPPGQTNQGSQAGLPQRAAPGVLQQPNQGIQSGMTQRAGQAIAPRQSLPGAGQPQGVWGQTVANPPQQGPAGPATSQRSLWDDASQFASGAAAGAVTGNPLGALAGGIINAATTDNPNTDEARAKSSQLKGTKLTDPAAIAAATGLSAEDIQAYLAEGYQFGSNNGQTFMVGPDGKPAPVAPHAGVARNRALAADEARFQQVLSNVPQVNAQDQVDAINAQAGMMRGRTIRSAMNAGARSGMSPEAMIGQTADIQNQTQGQQVIAASQARAQAAVQNANFKMQAVQAEMQHIENRIRETNDQAVRDKLFQQQQWLLAKQQEFQAKQIADQREYDTWTSLLNTGLGGGLQVAGMAAGGAFGSGGASGSAAG